MRVTAAPRNKAESAVVVAAAAAGRDDAVNDGEDE